jgi:ABC-2 type transport system ATP-binding protein
LQKGSDDNFQYASYGTEEICDHIKGKKILDGTVQNIKQDYKENLFKVNFTDKIQAEHLAIHLFEVIKKTDKEVIMLNPGHRMMFCNTYQ